MGLYHYAPFTLVYDEPIADEAPLSAAHSDEDAEAVHEASHTYVERKPEPS